MSKSPVFQLNNGVEIPAIGLGVLGRDDKDRTASSVEAALAVGYRMIDTAAAYGNEVDVGEGIRRSGATRSDVFVTTKLWLTQYGYEQALRGFDASLRRLSLDYVDLYLLHWPVPTAFEQTIDSWKAAEKLLADGRVRAIGVCNFSANLLDELVTRTSMVPAINQVELHPYFQQADLRETHERLGILTQAWSPIGGSVRRKAGSEESTNPLTDPVISGIAEEYAKTPSQVILRWHLQRGICAIPKSFNSGRIAENFDVFDFELSVDDMARINALDSAKRSGPDPEVVDARTFSITVED